MKYQITVWDHRVAYNIIETFWSDESAISFAKSRAHSSNNVRLYSCAQKRDIWQHITG